VSQQASLERGLESFYKTRRVDLTRYPCLCIDAERTKFRDDALGLRPRADTGRPVVSGASKWEVLVHIVDVGDIYTMHGATSLSDDDKMRLGQLKDASKSRGTSRYDLPLGPLHLMPPRVLQALSFWHISSRQQCLTLWAYIDERDGNLLDFGLERTWVRNPVILSYKEASHLLDTQNPEREIDAKERVLLLVLNRLLSRWNEAQMLKHEASQRRQERLIKRQLDLRATTGFYSFGEDDGFTRSSAHKMVDSALELYSTGVSTLLRESGAPIPQAKGAESFRGGRVATAPLRRYVDGEAQRQVLAVLFGQGRRLSAKDCAEIGRVANMARNSIANVRAARNS
jgi:exoribonuclease R